MARLYTNGWEFPTLALNQINVASGTGTAITATAAFVRKTGAGTGGLRALYFTTAGYVDTFVVDDMTSGWVRDCWFAEGATAEPDFYVRNLTSGNMFRVKLNTATRFVEVYNAAALVITSTTAINMATYYIIELAFVIAGPGVGTLTLRINGTEDGTFTGDTTGVAAVANQFRFGAVTASAAGDAVAHDDTAVNSNWATIVYDGGNGNPPIIGEAVTSGGKSGTLRGELGSGSQTGILYIETADTFLNNEVLVFGTSGFTATCDGGQIEKNRTWVGDGYILLLTPTANGNSVALTPTGAASNWQAVDGLEATGSYVSGTVADNFDLYAYDALPADALDVNHVQPVFYSRKDNNGLNYINAKVRSGGVDYNSPYSVIQGTDWLWRITESPQDPNTLAAWTVAGVNGMQAGPTLRSFGP